MNKEEFERLKNLEHRIDQLKITKATVLNAIVGAELKITTTVEIGMIKHTNPVAFCVPRYGGDHSCDEDKEYIIDMIQKRIDELQEEFDKY